MHVTSHPFQIRSAYCIIILRDNGRKKTICKIRFGNNDKNNSIREKPIFARGRLLPFSHLERKRAAKHEVMIMPHDFFFKHFFPLCVPHRLTKSCIQKKYDEEWRAFRESYNRSNPGSPLWIHGYSLKMTRWFDGKKDLVFYIQMVSFIYGAGPRKGESFTFMGSMFVSGSAYSKQFILAALRKGKEASLAKACVTSRILQKWRGAFSHAGERFARPLLWAQKEYRRRELLDEPGPARDFVFRVCIEILTGEDGRFPLWSLH